MLCCFQWRQMKLYSLQTAWFPKNTSVDHLLCCTVAETSFFATYKFLFSISEVLQLKPDVITLFDMPKECELLQAWLWALSSWPNKKCKQRIFEHGFKTINFTGKQFSFWVKSNHLCIHRIHSTSTWSYHLPPPPDQCKKNQKMVLNVISGGSLITVVLHVPPTPTQCLFKAWKKISVHIIGQLFFQLII